MPLLHGTSRSIISRNIGELISAGHDPKQAAAIAYRVSRLRGDRKRRPRDAVMRAPFGREVVGFTGQIVDGQYVPPPGQGSAPHNRPGSSDPAAVAIARANPAGSAAPDPNTRPTFVSRGDATRPRKRLARQIPPTRHEEDYAKALVKVMKRVRAAYAPVLRALPGLIKDAAAARKGDRSDAGESDKARRLLETAQAAARRAIPREEIDSLARKFAERTSTYQRIQLVNQVRSAIGVDPIFRDKGLAARVEQFTHENVALITRIPERLHGDVQTLVTRAIASGRPHEDLAGEIDERFDVGERHARLIARDQIGKFYAGVNHARQREMGVEKFVWRTAGDERVREEHVELDGQEFSYDEPPVVDGEEALPGEPVCCRCWADPVLDELAEDDEDDDQPEDDEESDDE